MKIKNNCDCCNRKKSRKIWSYNYSNERMILLCLECCLSDLCQNYKFDNKDVEWYLNFYGS